MPRSWTKKDERMYDHIKNSTREDGASTDRAKEVAARTVNKSRREEGRTQNRTSQGTGNPHTGLESRTVQELRNVASDLSVKGRSNMNKSELVEAIRDQR